MTSIYILAFRITIFLHWSIFSWPKATGGLYLSPIQHSLFLSTSLTQRLDPGSVFPRYLQLLAGGRAWSRDQGIVACRERGRLPVELQQQVVDSWGLSVPASYLPVSDRDAPKCRVHLVSHCLS